VKMFLVRRVTIGAISVIKSKVKVKRSRQTLSQNGFNWKTKSYIKLKFVGNMSWCA